MDAKLFLVYLQQEFSRRAGRNPGYSLRTYANQLGIHHGTLSQIMRGHRPLTYRRIESLIKVLDVSPQQLAKLQSPASDVELKFSPLDEDHFASVSDWYHDAILELTQVSGFKSNARWIATKLGVSVVEVNDAISRLVRLKHLDVSVEPWRDLSSSNSLVYSQVGSSAAVRKYQRQLLKISSDSIEGIAPFDRSHTSIVFALPRERIAQAEKIIREYRRKMVQLLKSEDVQCATDGPTSKNPDSIYALQISLFPLSKEIRS